MNPQTSEEGTVVQQRRLVSEIAGLISEAHNELLQQGKDPEKLLAKSVGHRLHQLHYFSLIGTKEVFKEFNASIDIVSWKASAAQAIAISFVWGLCDDRLSELDEFRPTLLLPRSPLIKILVEVNAPAGVQSPDNIGDTYIVGLSPTRRSSGSAATADSPEPF